ncbi:MAG: ATP phosphoribosyltransferase regulatory subunit [Dehalococcoidia bacterium]
MDPVKPSSGMGNLPDIRFEEKQTILQQFNSFMNAASYTNIEVPIMDNTELFLKKSDGQLAPQMYSFRDPLGQQVSLRPEITTQVMNYYLGEATEITEHRYQYQGPVFRFSETRNTQTQFTQMGAEYIGGSGPDVDIEILELAIKFLGNIGFDSYQCTMADLNLVHYIIDNFGLSIKAKNKIVENIQIFKQGSATIHKFGEQLSSTTVTGDSSKDSYLSSAIKDLSEGQARQVLSGFLGWVNGSIEEGSLGRRSHEDVVSRLIDKLRNTDSLENIQKCLSVIENLIKIKGSPDEAITKARALFSDQAYPLDLIDQFQGTINELNNRVSKKCELIIDFGLVKDFGYYNGIIFELTDLATNQLMGGGGRYDGLAKTLGAGRDVKALGFAFDLDKVLQNRTGIA